MSESLIEELIQRYDMAPHPEGGFFCETYRSPNNVDTPAGPRSVCTAIFFLLRQGDISHFHRIKSDEIWHFYRGETLEIYEIDEQGEIIITKLDSTNPQYIVAANRWFASRPAKESSFSFVGCTVAPGFDFADFEMATKEQLLQAYPAHHALIETLTLN